MILLVSIEVKMYKLIKAASALSNIAEKFFQELKKLVLEHEYLTPNPEVLLVQQEKIQLSKCSR